MSAEAQTLIEKWLLESPSSIAAASFGMDDPVKEARFVCKLKHDAGSRLIDQFGGLDLIKVGQTIFAENAVGLVFFVKWEDCKDVILPGRHCIQIVVWRRTAPPGMPRYTFYRHVL